MSYLNPASKPISSARTRFGLILAAVAIAIVFMPSISLAGVKNCPTEPTSTTIHSGDDYAGANCVLSTPGDVDSFVFSANAGDTWQAISAWQGGPGTCMVLYDPNGKDLFASCTGAGETSFSQTLSLTGEYTIILTMQGDSADGDYALSLERISPFPPDAQELTLEKAVEAAVAPTNEQTTYTFYGATTGTYLVSVSWTGGDGTCVYLFSPGSATAQPSPDQGCTGAGVFQFTFKPPTTGTYMLLLTGQGDGGGSDYSIEVSCYLGSCPMQKSTTTACTDAPSYDATTGRLTMDFTLGTPIAVTWYAWLVSGNTAKLLWSKPEPATEPTVSKPEFEGVAKQGKIGVLSTLTTPTEGITCSSWVIVDTGGS